MPKEEKVYLGDGLYFKFEILENYLFKNGEIVGTVKESSGMRDVDRMVISYFRDTATRVTLYNSHIPKIAELDLMVVSSDETRNKRVMGELVKILEKAMSSEAEVRAL